MLSGFVVFLILAPAIVLYVRGITYDFKTKKFITTAILAVSVNPSGAKVLLDGKEKRQGSGDIKFLAPDEYQVSLTKDGYQSWNKRLTVKSGQVTWASPAYSSIYLFYSQPIVKSLAADVADFYSDGNFLTYLDKSGFVITSIGNPGNSKTYTVPATTTIDTILTHDDSNKNFVLAGQATATQSTLLIFSSGSGEFINISALFSGTPTFQFSNGQLYALSNNVLYTVNLVAKTKSPLFRGVKTFYFQNGTLYFVQETANGSQTLLAGQAPFTDTQSLENNLPNFGQEQLLVTYEKQVLLIADSSLYLVNASLEKLADNISLWDFDIQNSTVALVHSGEFDYFNAFGNNLNFVTRSSEALSNLALKNNIDYAFFAKNNALTAIELDTRDSQNQYTLYQGSALQKFVIDGSGQNAVVLDGGELKALEVR